MKQNNAINILFLFLCILLLGFVYLNNKMSDSVETRTQSEKIELDNDTQDMEKLPELN